MNEFEPLFTKVEAAIDAHPLLRRMIENPVHCSPTFKVTRLGYWIEIQVKREGSRKRASEICADGNTAAEAADKLIAGLDYWAEAIK